MFKQLLLSLVVISSLSASEQQIRYAFIDKDGIHEVQPCFVDPLLKQVPLNKIDVANNKLAIRAVKLDNGEYMLRAAVRGEAGFLLSSGVAYWGTKVGLNTVYFVACYFDPILLADVLEVQALIETAATTAAAAAIVTPL